VYDFASQRWQTLETQLPTPRAGNSAVFYQNEILVIGGESETQTAAHDDVEAFNISSQTWRSLAHLKHGRHGTGAALFDNKVFVPSGCGARGGFPELESMEAFFLEDAPGN
jgi:N-acetylneuraminic acid mutarotase